MNGKVLLVALMATAVCASLTHAASHKRDLNTRHKRSFSFLPSFLGGGSKETPAEEDEAVVENDVQNEVPGPVPMVGPYQDPNFIKNIINNGRVINNQVHYPIWRVQKYNGIHLQPLPISLVHDPSAVQTVQQTTEQYIDDDNLPPITEEVETWLTPELIQMARQFGVKDFSNVPSLEDAMNVLGTSNKDETIQAIKEFAKSEDGRSLIRDFVKGQEDKDNEVAASETVEQVEDPDDPQKVMTAEFIKAFQNTPYTYFLDESDGAAENYEGQPTIMSAQYLYPPLQAQLIQQLSGPAVGSGPAQTEEESEAENADVETTTQASLFGRISQWTSFLNPFTNRQEIPIPPVESELNYTENLNDSENLNDEHIQNQDTSKLPELPELPSLPQWPGESQDSSQLPEIHIPNRYISPYSGNLQSNNGQYVRVRLPLAGFNPTPQYAIDPKYLQFARNQLNGQRVQIIPNVQTQYVQYAGGPAPVAQNPIKIHHQVATNVAQPIADTTYVNQPIQAGQFVQPIQASQLAQPIQASQFAQVSRVPHPLQVAQIPQQIIVNELVEEIENLSLPIYEPIPFTTVVQNFAQLPVVPVATSEVFRNAPRIVDSHGAPAPPYTYEFDGLPNSYYVSPHANSVYIQQEYELPAASEIVERKTTANDNIDAEDSADNGNDNEQRIHVEVVDEDEQNEQEEQVEQDDERANKSEEEITIDVNHNNENDQSAQSQQSEEQKAIEIGEENVDDDEKTDAIVESPSNKMSIYESLRPKILKSAKAPNEKRSVPLYKRHTSHDQVKGVVQRADPKSIDMVPFTVRHMAESAKTTNTTNDKPE